MKKQLFLASLLVLALISCEKKNNDNKHPNLEDAELVDISDEINDSVFTTVENNTPFVSPIQRQEKLIEAAQKNPLTTLAINENHFDFQDIKEGETVSHQFELTNTGDKPLIISFVKPGCGCTAPEFSKEPILPGKKGYVTLNFNSTNFQGLQRKAAEVYANVENLPVVLTFSANVLVNQTN